MTVDPTPSSHTSLESIFTHWNETAPTNLALLAPNRSPLTFAQMGQQLAIIRKTLLQLGLRRTARIALLAPNGPELAVGFLGLASAAICAPLNPAYRTDELAFYLNDLEASALVIAAKLDSPAREVARARGIPILELHAQLDQPAGCLTLEGKTGLAPVNDQTATTDDIALILHTSGTTAKPKQVPLSHANLCASLRHLQQSLTLTPTDRGLNLMPLFHIHGLVGSLLAALGSGGSLVCPSGFVSEEFFSWLQEFQPSWYSSVPTIHQAILAQARTEVAPRASASLRFIRSSSASLPPTVMEEVEKVFGVPVIEAYGMTEAAHQMASNPLPPNVRKPGSVGLPAGPEIAILSEMGKALPKGEIGEVAIKGPNVMTGYSQNASANAHAFTNGWFRTGDQGYFDPDGYLFLTGRFKELINRGGEKISPLEIDQALLTHPAVAQAVTFALSHSTLGEDVAAAVVLESKMAVTAQELRIFLATSLAAFKIPRQITFVPEIPKGPTGKLQRIGLAKVLGLETTVVDFRNSTDPPRTSLETILVELWQEVLEIATIGVKDDFFTLGGDSLSATRLLLKLREQLNVAISFEAFFGHLTIAGLATLIEATPRLEEVDAALPLKACTSDEPVPLSFAQQRMWFLEQLEPGNSALHCAVNLELLGPLDTQALEEDLASLVARHAILRTTFPQTDGIPMQVVSLPNPVLVTRREWHLETDKSWDDFLHQVAEQELQPPFDLDQGPVWRATLVQRTPENHVLLLTFHHILIDDRSQEILLHELPFLYEAHTTTLASPLPPIPFQYRDTTVWERERLQGQYLAKHVNYWRNQLADQSPLELPLDRPRPSTQTSRGATVHRPLSPMLTNMLHAMSQQHHVTLFMTLVAALQVLLFRYTNQADISIGTPSANRSHPEMESIFGFFANTLVLRGNLNGNPSFAEFLQQIRQVAIGAYDHQAMPFEQLVEVLQPTRDPSRTPLFQVLLDLQPPQISAKTSTGLTFTRLDSPSDTATFDMALSVRPTLDRLNLQIVYKTDLFDALRIERMLGHLETLLDNVVTAPTTRIAALSLLTEQEQQQLLIEWNDTKITSSQEQTIVQLFESRVAITPESVALEYEEEQLTYGQLNLRANQLGHYLKRLGIGPKVLVGLCVDRSLEMVIGMLGILKAGGAYVPLDPKYPPERLAFMLVDTGLSTLLTYQRHIALFSSYQGKLVCLDTDWSCVQEESSASPTPTGSVIPDNLAYLIYTSGSTGAPKGIGVVHRGVVRLIQNTNYIEFTANDVMLQFAPLGFDASTFEVWGILLNGGRLVLYSDRTPSLEEFSRFIQRTRITTLWLTAPLFHQMMVHVVEAFQHVRQLLTGGDVVSVEHAQRFAHRYPRAQLINAYGPTENTVFTCCYWIRSTTLPGGSLPIGRSISQSQVYVLDSKLELIPIGVHGELCAGGAGLALGYWNRPDFTAENFVPNAFSDTAGSRLYRTGDLARYASDGTLEFLGRNDHQVKIRGFRIELGEIEAALGQLPSIQESVVLCRENTAGDKHLVAYIVPLSNTSSDPTTLRNALKAKLPEYMVPTSFVTLEVLPLTPNGKIDYQALPVSTATHRAVANIHEVISTPLELQIAQVWATVLGVERIGRHDNFFELGGHSLNAMQVNSRLQTQMQVDLPLRTIFEYPTVSQFAETMEEVLATTFDSSPLTLCPRKDDGPIPLSFAQQRLWFLAQWEPKSTAYNEPYVCRLHGLLDRTALAAAFTDLIARHEILRTNFEMRDDQPIQVICTPFPVTLPVIDLTLFSNTAQEMELDQLIEEEVYRAFDLSKDSLVRSQLFHLGSNDHVLLVVWHHIIIDGWSMRIFWEELSTFYSAQLQGHSAPLSPLPIQYADFSIWQRGWLQDDLLARQVNYWKCKLADASPALMLPLDFPRPAQQLSRGAVVSFTIPLGLTQALKTLSHQEGVTLFMTLLAAFQLLLARHSNQQEILVGTPTAGRTRTELEGLIGFFANTLVLRTVFIRQASFHEILQQIQQTCVDAYDHQDVPFEKLVEELQPFRDASRHPLFQVMFQLIKEKNQALTLPELKVTSYPRPHHTAKFDLNCTLRERDGVVHGVMEYNRDLFEAATITRMTKQFQVLLEGILHNIDEHVFLLPLLTDTDRQQLLVDWNPPAQPIPGPACLHQFFEIQVEKTPDSMAVFFEEEQVTYSQLNQRANKLAHWLRRHGVEPEACVGLCVTRSLDMLVGLLGILKAGGVCVPLDPSYPSDRLRFMATQANVRILITQSSLTHQVREFSRSVIYLDTEWAQLAHEPIDNLQTTISPVNLVYVLFTSGSTGQPKGVALPHAALVNLISWQQTLFSAEQRTLQFSSMGFDASFFELFSTWSSGSNVVMVPEEMRRDPAQLLYTLTEQRIERAILPSVLLTQMAILPQIQEGNLTAFQDVITTGDQLHITPAILNFFKQHSSCRLHNHYGPTESHVVTAYTLGATPKLWEVYPSIGFPIRNSQVWLLDRDGGLVPPGVIGELHIGGVCLARGYIHQPELTAERFRPSFVSTTPGARAYQTGDHARYDRTGAVHFLERRDHQVKLRGYRIELSEIEVVLGQQPGIQETLVLCREDKPYEKQLVAYIIPTLDASPDPAILRAMLKTRLPEYMMPTSFVLLNAFPLTPNGKVDRGALPAPDLSHRTMANTYVAPVMPLEQQIAKVWEEVLGVEHIGRHDNFFELGGHSLLATTLLVRLQRTLQTELTVRTLFENPTVAEIAQQLMSSPEADRVLDHLSRPATSRDVPLPLSFAQQRFWFLEQIEQGQGDFCVPVLLRLHGIVDIKALEQSFQWIARRHDILRTCFPDKDGTPTQLIAPDWKDTLPLIDVEGQTEPERTATLAHLIDECIQHPFDLRHGPLMKTTLLQLSQTESVLVITFHHIVSDGWSMGVFQKELMAAYDAYAHGLVPQLPPLSLQYGDYTLWQREWLQGERLDTLLSFWRQQLAGAPIVLELPTDHSRFGRQTFRGSTEHIHLPATLTKRLKALARGERSTLFMVLLSAFKVLLARYTGGADIVVGSPIANRPRIELEQLIGFFVNTLVLRTDLSDHPSFRTLLSRVRDSCLDAYTHQDLPFEKLVEELRPERDVTRHPLVQVLFTLQNAPTSSWEFPGLQIEALPVNSRKVAFDVSFSLTEHVDGLEGSMTYKADLFEPATIIRMLKHFNTLLENIVEDPDQLISLLTLLPEDEREQLIHFDVPIPIVPWSIRHIHTCFEQQVRKHPDKIALVWGDENVTYQQLNAQANQLAHALQHRGVKPETCVAIHLERSLNMAVGLLGILKAGGCYVPLDPMLPLERLNFMLSDAQVELVLTETALLKTWPDQTIRSICIDDENIIANQGQDNIDSEVHGENLAYIIFTSGSTGLPKGVGVSHENVMHLLEQTQSWFEFGEDDVWTCFHSYAFDFSVWELFGGLLSGGHVVLVPYKITRAPDAFYDILVKEQVTVLNQTPSAFQQLIHVEKATSIHSDLALRFVIFGGEALDIHSLTPWIEHHGDLRPRLINMFGITETTVHVTYRPLTGADFQSPSRSGIGVPISNTYVYILDDAGHPLPIGVSGELHVGGAGITRGYVNHPELTSTRFVPNPYSTQPGRRLYRSGDLARRLSNGELDYLGRRDHQVQVRGFRIELGEIETRLRQHPIITDVAVIVHDQEINDVRIVAYLVANDDEGFSPLTLRTYLGQWLPSYMLPAAFVLLPTLPLTPNGKLDRQALPSPQSSRSPMDHPKARISTPVEDQLAQIWCTLLKVDHVGINESFFELGGHSLLLTQLANRIQQTFHIRLPLRILFDVPTIEELAYAILEYQVATADPTFVNELLAKIEQLTSTQVRELLKQDTMG